MWLHSQTFYKNIQQKAVKPLKMVKTDKSCADIGCSTGLMTRLTDKLNYKVIGYDLNNLSLYIARILSFRSKNIKYINQNFDTLSSKFDLITATSFLSVVNDKKTTLNKLISHLKDKNSILIIIEPTQKLSVKNVFKMINSIKTFWFYKGLLVWAKAREDKSIDFGIFDDIRGVEVSHKFLLGGMVCVTYITNIAI